MTSFTDRFGGITVYPSDIGYLAYSLTTSATLVWPELGDTSSNLAASFIRASSTVTGSAFVLPDARDCSVGRALRIKNIGSITIPVFSTSGSTIASVTSGKDYLLSLIDNTTSGGLWDTEQLGVGTSSADASALAGNGLTVSSDGKLMVNWPVYFTGSNGYQLTATSRASLITWTGGAGEIGIAFDGGTIPNGYITTVKNFGTGILTITGNFADDIDGGTVTLLPNDSTFIVGGGVNNGFYTVGLTNQNSQGVLNVEFAPTSSGSQVTLTSAQCLNKIFILFGELANGAAAAGGDATLTFPQIEGEFVIQNLVLINPNAQGNSGYIIIKTSAVGGRTVKIAVTATRTIVSDGTNIDFADDFTLNRPAQNYIYFADFSKNPWQRGTSFTSSSVAQYMPDRVSVKCTTGGAGWTISRVASANTGCQYDMQVARISGSPSASGRIFVGFDLDVSESISLRGKSPSLAMDVAYGFTNANGIMNAYIYAISTSGTKIVDSVTGATLIAGLGNAFISGNTTSTYYNYITNPYAYTVAFTPVSSTVNAVSVLLDLQFSGTGTATQYFNFSRIALVDGNFQTFDNVESTDILAKCQRYAYTVSQNQSYIGVGKNDTTTGAIVSIPTPVTLRSAPTLTVSGGASAFNLTTSAGALLTCTSVVYNSRTQGAVNLQAFVSTASLLPGHATQLFQSGSGSLILSADI